MPLAPFDTLRDVFDRFRAADHGDGELLSRYKLQRDQDAFGSLVRRHGPMVLGVCRRVLRDAHAADDAFQATFLVLAKKADAVRPPDRLAPWLYGVAYRTAMKARGRAIRRQQVERAYAAETANRPTAAPVHDGADLLPVIDEQLNSLPEKYRAPLVLCGVQGLNKAKAAEKLGLPEGTVSSRLARAREMLRDRLARRGVVVPAAALGSLLCAESLQAAVPPALAAAAVEVVSGALVPPAVLALTHEVLRSMTLFELKTLCAVALAIGLTGGGFGLYALHADEKKPGGEKPAVKPDGEKSKPAKPAEVEKPKPAPDGEKPAKPDGEKKPVRPFRLAGQVAAVDAKENTVMLAVKSESGVVEKVYALAAGAKVFIDNKEAKLADVPKNAFAAGVANAGAKDGDSPQIAELRVTGRTAGGVVKDVSATAIALESEKKPQEFKVASDTKVTVNGKDAKIGDIKAGDRVVVTLKADESAALSVVSGRAEGEKPGKPDGEKPGVKNPKFGGKVASVDAATRVVMLAGKGEGGREVAVKLTADAKVVVDGVEKKIGDIPKGAFATFTLVSAKDGQPREANAVVVAGLTFTGVIKQIDATSVTVGTEKSDRVVKLAPGGKVLLGEKEAKLSDLKVGDKATVTLTSDESAAAVIQGAVKKGGDKPKPEE